METNPLYYQLSARTVLEPLAHNRLAIVKLVKSRIIRKDAEKIAAMAQQIKKISPEMEVTLVCTHNICSKSIALLAAEGIEILYRE